MPLPYDVVIVGAGSAGVGMGVVLKGLGVQRFALIDRYGVGASFERWPTGMRLITPSFVSNAFGQLDLNAVTLNTSPAFTLGIEHPTGAEYASYLRSVAKHFELPVERGVDVKELHAEDGGFAVQTSRGVLYARQVIWAAGEFQYPNRNSFPGAEFCIHSSEVRDWKAFAGSEAIVIGGYESGADAAVQIAEAGGTVQLIDRDAPWEKRESDPSVTLSPFTKERLARHNGALKYVKNVEVAGVIRESDQYRVLGPEGQSWTTKQAPVLATGFRSSLSLVRGYFEWTEHGTAMLTDNDESTRASGLFLVGPQVRHQGVIFCFIYKYRQRFAVVGAEIARRLGLSLEPLEEYRRNNMYLDDLSCCGKECAC